MDAASELRIIACTRGGPDANVDISAATERGIPVLYTPGRNAVSVADLTLGLMLSIARHVARSHHLLRLGEFTGEPQSDTAAGGEREDVSWGVARGSPYVELKGPELEGKTLGIVGLGAIGQLVAARASGFDMDLVGFDPFVDAEQMDEWGVRKVDLEELCTQSDFVTVHCPVTEETRGLIGAEEFALMSENTYFINTARGSIIDQDALLSALRDGELAGAALDVYDKEPLPADHELLELDNVVTTPHIGGAATGVIERHSEMVTNDIAALLDGRDPTHVANDVAPQASHKAGGD
jgi:D-3-phosphoglycerate dehydrogenase